MPNLEVATCASAEQNVSCLRMQLEAQEWAIIVERKTNEALRAVISDMAKKLHCKGELIEQLNFTLDKIEGKCKCGK